MKLASSFVTLALAIGPAFAAVPLWGQCAGVEYRGDTVCVSGTECVFFNDWYSQCQTAKVGSSLSSAPAVGASSTEAPGSTAPISTPATSTKVSSAKPSSSQAVSAKPSSTKAASTTASSVPAPSGVPSSTGFVKVSGEEFTLNGSKFSLIGTNSYWVGLSGFSEADMDKAFADMAAAGATTVRTWGFNEVTSPSGVYYQSWSGGVPKVNTGPDGLQNFDNVVKAAKAHNIRLIVALTNNWKDYGGMDIYVDQILGAGKPHDLFYTDPSVKAAFKDYVKTFVGRYVNEPTILGWELANEPRCIGSSGVKTPSCNTATITAWVKELSAYVKSIDSNHLVALGDEGFFNDPSAPTYPYQGSEGVDFDANLAIETIDFGTFHSYPEAWDQGNNVTPWGTQWILDHAASQKRAGKPVILEEYGVSKADKIAVYDEWHKNMLSSKLTGSLYWHAGSRFASGSTHDDGFTVFPDSPAFSALTSFAAIVKEQ